MAVTWPALASSAPSTLPATGSERNCGHEDGFGRVGAAVGDRYAARLDGIGDCLDHLIVRGIDDRHAIERALVTYNLLPVGVSAKP